MILFVFQLSFVAEKVEQVDGKVQTRKLSKEEEIKLLKRHRGIVGLSQDENR